MRSTPGISAVKALHYVAPLLKRFGGHTQAAGFAIQAADIPAFKVSILEFVANHPAPELSILADAALSASQIDDDLYKAIQSLEPYGEGHPSPLFALTDTLDMARAVGQTKSTLQLRISGIKGVAWRKGELAQSFTPGETVSAVVSLRENHWNNQTTLEFIAEDLRKAKPLTLEPSKTTYCFHKGKPAGDALHIRKLEDIPGDITQPLRLETLPLKPDLLCTTLPLEELVKSGATLYFDLNQQTLRAINQRLILYPKLGDVRRAFVAIQRGQALPYAEQKNELIMQILEELELLKQGKALKGQKRNPYDSNTLLQGMLERYKLESFLNAYKYYANAAFAETVNSLFA